ncbi:winged helix-turn-helix transcriptional regulator [Tianweitania sediminis]|jgi:DNA-binding HxlR family transcriptional regulator|uniref:Helix-turn-helix transcriptional regulator n=1 Tax=Tianweitania sediminis TaxID=1502156 RepID=A0A8J7R200_9HYPH|nr:helix-turn-helix domain-containing protein [Tianweitania sediminis]MBP0439318.1 helix-turn-helix transcriptional regulator [Tianweitania sediminis]
MIHGNSADCRAVSGILARVGDKWTVLVVELLGKGPMRFNELRRMIGGISQKMLTATLRGLERDGFVTRTVYPTIPPRVDYELTDLGRELLVPVHALGDWARVNIGRVEAARARFDSSQKAA